MKHPEKLADIQYRHDLALAERNCVAPGSQAYEVLTEVARLIRGEYMTCRKGEYGWIRHGFRVHNGVYRDVVLAHNEIC